MRALSPPPTRDQLKLAISLQVPPTYLHAHLALLIASSNAIPEIFNLTWQISLKFSIRNARHKQCKNYDLLQDKSMRPLVFRTSFSSTPIIKM